MIEPTRGLIRIIRLIRIGTLRKKQTNRALKIPGLIAQIERHREKMKKLYRKIRFWFYSFKEDPKYPCRYDEIVQGAYSRGYQDGYEMASVPKKYMDIRRGINP